MNGFGPSEPIPVLIVIDAEPDGIYVEPGRGEPWVGFEKAVEILRDFRAEATATSGAPAHFTWVYRMDPQVELGYGSASWPVVHYVRETAELDGAGDDLGLHPHGFRWCEATRRWLTPLDDQAWLDECLHVASDAFERSHGRRCRTFRYGDHWMSQATMELLQRLGARYDLTLEPGHPQTPITLFRHGSGVLPDLSDIPATPYRPSRDDYRVGDPSRDDGLVCIPMTTASVRPRLSHAFLDFLRKRGTLTRCWTAVLSQDPFLFRRVIRDAWQRRPSHLAIPVRSDAFAKPRLVKRVARNLRWLLSHPLGSMFRWSTADEAYLGFHT